MGTDDEGKGFVSKIVAKVRQKAAVMGASALVAYLLIDIVVYAFALTAAREAFLRSTGKEPWADIRGFLLVVGGIWAGNNATRPLRLAGAAALSPVTGKAMQFIEDHLPAKIRQASLPGGATFATPLAAGVLLAGWGIFVVSVLGAYLIFLK
eukprot:TRINITY_DN61496_c0_g1_i1.p1 TRINITY_DN61496_c0_g1~~TRINITY_DN61496_c0_g1_i1.p1  ORF type:complete len:152 (+),score=31.14 TRINITY_DN61496_c0_g1_i1:58-513(+)